MKRIYQSIAVIAFLVLLVVIQSVRLDNANNRYDDAMQNNKAYESQINVLQDEKKVFVFDISQLKYMNDSTIRQLDSMRREIGIRDSKIRQMGRIREYVYLTDTIVLHDTIFNKGLVLDTMIGDKWYENSIHLEYPSTISSSVQVNTEQSCFLHTVKETVDPPKKTWIGRLFQRKHDVYEITVKENNPYITIKENKFIMTNDN